MLQDITGATPGGVFSPAMEDRIMAETADPSTETTVDIELPGDPDQLGDGGKKALDAERRRANTAEKALKSLQQRLDELESEKLSKEERASKERDLAFAERDAARAEVLRYKIAARHAISDEDAELFLTGTDEETLTRQAERLADRKPSGGLYVPAEGRNPSAPALNSDGLEGALKRKLGIK